MERECVPDVENNAALWVPKAPSSSGDTHPSIKRPKTIILLFNFDVKNVHKGAKNIEGGKDSLFN